MAKRPATQNHADSAKLEQDDFRYAQELQELYRVEALAEELEQQDVTSRITRRTTRSQTESAQMQWRDVPHSRASHILSRATTLQTAEVHINSQNHQRLSLLPRNIRRVKLKFGVQTDNCAVVKLYKNCDRCRMLKRKCDRMRPCAQCRHAGCHCIFSLKVNNYRSVTALRKVFQQPQQRQEEEQQLCVATSQNSVGDEVVSANVCGNKGIPVRDTNGASDGCDSSSCSGGADSDGKPPSKKLRTSKSHGSSSISSRLFDTECSQGERVSTSTAETPPVTLDTSALTDAPHAASTVVVTSDLSRQHTQDDTTAECTICRCEFVDPIETPCKHKFCRECVSYWFAQADSGANKGCPVCRSGLRAWVRQMKLGDQQLPEAWQNEAGGNEISIGTAVEANWQGEGHWFKGTCVGVHNDAMTYDIGYDDGDYEENVEMSLVRLRRLE